MARVAYYAHHVGSGHLQHARNVATSGVAETLILTSANPTALGDLNVAALPTDIVDGYEVPDSAPFHYAPTGDVIRKRFVAIHDALEDFRPDVVISDVSAEVTAFSRLCGYPVISRRMHGDRDDRAHQNMFDTASALLSYFPHRLITNADLRLDNKTTFAGMLDPLLISAHESTPESVVVLTSLGGTGVDLNALGRAAATTDWKWTVVGKAHGDVPDNVAVKGTVQDPTEALTAASVIICSSGHNAVRSAIASGRPFITFPEPRPYNEQLRFAEALQSEFGIPFATDWDQDWPELFERAAAVDLKEVRSEMFVDKGAFANNLEQAIDFALKN